MYVCRAVLSIGFFFFFSFDSRLANAVGMSGRIWGRIQQCLFNVIAGLRADKGNSEFAPSAICDPLAAACKIKIAFC